MKNKDDLMNDDHEVEAQYMLCALVLACLDPKNELVLSLYSLNSKTSRYAHSAHCRIAVN